MRKKFFIATSIILVACILFIAYFVLFPPGPDLSKYEFLKQPRITNMPDQKMLVVTVQGDPNAVANKAFRLLFKTYFKIPGVPKSMNVAPRARWAGDMKVKSSWTGYYAMPVPEQTSSLPEISSEPGYKVELLTWEYGDVGEILHVGPYAEETPTIERLHQFIRQQGYEIIGFHEEEYLKGPSMVFRGDPAKYATIIRYRVKKKT
jgi:effector-binding domain-containing protein